MGFGSEETFNKIKNEALAKGSSVAYAEIYEIVFKSAISRLKVRAPHVLEEDRNDIAQEVCIKIFNRLVEFVNQSGNKNEFQRTAWLNRIIDRTLVDFYRKGKTDTIHLEEIYQDMIKTAIVDEESHELAVELIEMMLECVMNANTDVQNILTFLDIKILGIMSVGEGNAKPKDLEKQMKGRKLIHVARIIIDDIESMIGERLSSELVDNLMKKIEDSDADRTFSMKASAISDKSSRLMKKCMEYIYKKRPDLF